MFYLKPHFLLATRINNLEQYSDALFGYWSPGTGASLMAQWVKNLPAVQETLEIQIQSLGQEDPLEGEMATHSSILAWEIPWTEGPGGLQSMGSQKVRHN